MLQDEVLGELIISMEDMVGIVGDWVMVGVSCHPLPMAFMNLYISLHYLAKLVGG